MPLRRQVLPEVEPVATPRVIQSEPKALTAAATSVRIPTAGANALRIRDEDWQREAWRLYDLIGEHHFAATRYGNSVGRARLYIAEVDEMGMPGAEVTDPAIQMIAATMFGGPTERVESIKTMAVSDFVAGECYIVAEDAGNADEDVWYIVSPAQIRTTPDGVEVTRPERVGGGKKILKLGTGDKDGKDLLIRHLNPHPRFGNVADSPTRSALPVLREIEQLAKLTFSQIDSRLISAGLLFLPKNLSFPRRDNDGNTVMGNIRDLADMILEAAQASLTGAGTAAGLVPILADIPEGTAKDIVHMRFDTPLTAEIEKKIEQAIRRLALSLDMNPETLTGLGSMNHWSAWAVTEDEINTHVTPILGRIVNTLTVGYVRPALAALGKDPEKFTLWFDTSPLAVRPNRLQDALELHKLGVINDDELRRAGAFDEDAKPTKKQRQEWMAWQLLMANPQLATNPAILELVGLPEEIATAAQEAAQEQMKQRAALNPPPGATQEALPPGQQNRDLPEEPERQSPAQAGDEDFAALLPGAELAVHRALELAGARLVAKAYGRNRFPEVPKFEIHTRVGGVGYDRARELVEGAFAGSATLLARHFRANPAEVETLLDGYCVELLTRGVPHDTELLDTLLRRARRGNVRSVAP